MLESKKAEAPVNLAHIFSRKSSFHHAKVWIIGTTPLITHAWSFKARNEMLQKQEKKTKRGREMRTPRSRICRQPL